MLVRHLMLRRLLTTATATANHPAASSAAAGAEAAAEAGTSTASASSSSISNWMAAIRNSIVGSSNVSSYKSLLQNKSHNATRSSISNSSLSWPEAVAAAEALVASKTSGSVIDPKALLGNDLSLLTNNIRRLLGSGHPVLSSISSYYFQAKGKHIRPVLVLLVSQATYPLNSKSLRQQQPQHVDHPISTISNIHFPNENPSTTTASSTTTTAPTSTTKTTPTTTSSQSRESTNMILPTQRRLAEITEMIHTASLLHDDVIDVSMTRRAQPSVNAEFGNKMAILAGDFLLARASVAMARLRNVEVVEILSTVISNLVEGEFMQLRNSSASTSFTSENGVKPLTRFEYYLEKTYMKTASLIAKSCQAAAVLGGCSAEVVEAAYSYGRNLGLAFQLVDDMLDFVVDEVTLGKPANADLKLGLATAPVLYASEEHPELLPLIERQFKNAGDAEKALTLVHSSEGIGRTKALAASYCVKAIEALDIFPPSPAKDALIQLTQSVLNRSK